VSIGRIVCVLLAPLAVAQESPQLQRLLEEAHSIRRDPTTQFDTAAQFKAALRDWLDARLPASGAALDRDLSSLQQALAAELAQAGLLRPENVYSQPGYGDRVELSRPDPSSVVAVAGITVGCGHDDEVLVYDYGHGARRRILESNGTREHDESVLGTYMSTARADGSRLFLTLRFAIQCGSSWNMLAYDLFRLNGAAATRVFSGVHSIWFGGGDPKVELKPDDLRIEVSDRSIDAGVHSRTHVLHYKVGPTAVTRIDPVALQPQDFVDEWLTGPWSEVVSRSAVGSRATLKQWHDRLHSDLVAGEYEFVQECTERPHTWQIAVTLDNQSTYFLVRELGQHRYEMVDVSAKRQPGCPGESPPVMGGEPPHIVASLSRLRQRHQETTDFSAFRDRIEHVALSLAR